MHRMLKKILLLVIFTAKSDQYEQHEVSPNELVEFQWLEYEENETPYRGEDFPVKYLHLEPLSSREDVDLYLAALNRTITYLLPIGNDTDLNIAFTGYHSVFTLKRTLRDHSHKFTAPQLAMVKEIVHNIEYLLSHFTLWFKNGEHETISEIIKMYSDDEAEVRTLSTFQRGRLAPWLRSALRLNTHAQALDTATFDRLEYHRLMLDITNHHIQLNASDQCLANIARNPEPSLTGPLKRCVADKFCEEAMSAVPSTAYTLSHRQLNLELRRLDRRCLVTSPDNIDALCAWMFREAVYIARRGFFAQDMFVEHVAMCGVHEEMNRPSWYRKIAAMVHENGCASESFTFKVRHAAAQFESDGPWKKLDHATRSRKVRKWIEDECDFHLMAVIMWALSGAVRHAAYWL